MKTFVLTCFFAMAVSLNLMQASVTTDIETANKAGKAVFLVVTDAENANTVKAIEIANKAQLQYKNSTVLRMNRSDAANAEFVAKNRLSGAPLPLILVIAPNGVITAGFTTDKATPEALVAAIPSPKKADVQKYLSQGKSVFIVVTNKSMSTKDNVMNTCQQACIEMENNSIFAMRMCI